MVRFDPTVSWTEDSALTALSPLDGRYAGQLTALRTYFSEFALIRYRLLVEVEWLVTLCAEATIPEAKPLTAAEIARLRDWVQTLTPAAAAAVKERERVTRHDVKAVEYVLRDQLTEMGRQDLEPFVHFACTSEDINNVAYALMLRDGLAAVWRPAAEELVGEIEQRAQATADLPMLARTHGQPASPTTLGKELAVFAHRLRRQLKQIDAVEYLAKMSGAVGAYNAHVAAYPEVDWPALSKAFLQGFGLTQNILTTQIESHDYVAELFFALARFNNILKSFDQDMWAYISLSYFKLKLLEGEVGSSTMPHKVNPIDFENSEANTGLSSAVLEHLANKLPISRLQRDLSDSSALRNVGVGIGYGLLAIRGALAGLRKTEPDPAALAADLADQWAVLGEAIQTVLRKHGHLDAYERLKAATQDRAFSAANMSALLDELDLPQAEKDRLKALTPAQYVGLAPALGRSRS